jgi:hypothetical protein
LRDLPPCDGRSSGRLADDAARQFSFASSDEGRRRFCPACGTALTFESSDYPDETDLTAASLDHPALAPPRDHTWSNSALEWFWTLHRLPQREKAPPDL